MRKLPLRVIITIPLVVQMIGIASLIAYLSYKNGQQAVHDLAQRLIEQVSDRVNTHLDNYLALPHQINQLNLDEIESGRLNLYDLPASGNYFWQQLQVFDVSYINYALVTGEFIGAGRWLRGDAVIIDDLDPKINSKNYIYTTDARGNRKDKVKVYDNYKPHSEAWYVDAVRVGKPTWTRIYNWDDVPEYISISGSRPIYDKKGQLLGVLGVDLLLTKISDYLRKIEISPTGAVFILERNGLLVASSRPESPFSLVSGEAKRLSALNSRDPLIQQTARYLQQRFGTFQEIEDSQQLTLRFDRDREFVRVTPWRDRYGLDWLVVVVVPERDFMAQIEANTNQSILLCLLALLVALAVGIWSTRLLTRPIIRLNKAAQQIAASHLYQTIESEGSSELDELAQSFNCMASQLQTSFNELRSLNQALSQSKQQLASQNQTLEEQVQQRTQELSQALQQLQTAQQELIETTQQKLIQSEKMASLGELVASVAHEINNPLAAITASISNVKNGIAQVKQQLKLLLQTLAPERIADFFALLDPISPLKEPLSFKQERQLKISLKKALEAQKIHNAATIAEILSRMGISPELEPLMPLLKLPNNVAIAQTAQNLFAIQNNTNNIQLAVERSTKTVLALKNYARQNVSTKMVRASVTDGIDIVLTIYHNQIKRGITVVKTYEPVPPILCYPDELMQVWSNLIHNAIQAMNEKGQLQISVRERDNFVVVEVSDTGYGIEPDIQDKIFQSFFTTKPAGEGIGLGLNIVRKIIDKHQGKVEVESQPGNTTFRVKLPI